jgi:predicted site-specific integrase-resolvase
VKEWLTIPEAAALVGRDKTNVYAWIRAGRLTTRNAADGTMEVRATDVTRVEATVKRGRPIGTARPG